ncbi:hypothetical protein FSP39_003624, partial [Pinctada imbricata]
FIPLNSVKDELRHVPQNIKEKIYKGEYVELIHMIPKSPSSNEKEKRFVIVEGELVLKSPETRKINDIETWTSAFITFSSIIVSRNPGQAQSLLKYMHLIRTGANRQGGSGWKTYDEQFRYRKGVNTMLEWGEVDNELWLLYMQPVKPYPNLAESKTLYCFNFNYKAICTRPNCKYLHKCLTCKGSHPHVMCFRSRDGHTNVRNPTPRLANPRSLYPPTVRPGNPRYMGPRPNAY